VIPSLLRYSYCSGSLTLPTHVSSWDDSVFSKLASRKESTDHLWEEENQCPFCASWNCIAFPRLFPRMAHSAHCQHELWEPWWRRISGHSERLQLFWKSIFPFTQSFTKTASFAQNEARFLYSFLAAYLYTQAGLTYPQYTAFKLGREYLAVTFKL